VKTIRVTRRARARLSDILHYSICHRGGTVALHYRDSLVARLRALAAGEPPAGRPCDLLMSANSRGTGLKYFREGGHYMIYRETDEALVVLDFVHQSRNLDDMIDRLIEDGKK
jgi:plasmid stabilization system protein ParE